MRALATQGQSASEYPNLLLAAMQLAVLVPPTDSRQDGEPPSYLGWGARVLWSGLPGTAVRCAPVDNRAGSAASGRVEAVLQLELIRMQLLAQWPLATAADLAGAVSCTVVVSGLKATGLPKVRHKRCRPHSSAFFCRWGADG